MKNKSFLFFLLVIFLLNGTFAFSQAPPAIPFQAAARNGSGNLLTNQSVSLRFSIRDLTTTGAVVYQETHTETTDGYGLFTVRVGMGSVVSGSFSTINWGVGMKFLQVEIDPAGGSDYVNMGTQQMLSVPFALYAEKTGTAGLFSPYGDGSAGALNITSNTNWVTFPPNLNMQYTDITIAAGVTLTVPSGTTLRATGNVTINGTIDVATGTSNNPGISVAPPSTPSGGIGLGNSTAALPLIKLPIHGGGAGMRNIASTGSEGGGSFRIIAKGNISVSSTGRIFANGRNNVNPQTAGLGIIGGGGGGGGIIVLLSKGTLTMAGSLTANGGNGSNGFDGNGGSGEGGGGGGGGGIIIYAAVTNSITGTSSVQGGTGGTNMLSSGTASTTAGGGGGASGGNGGTGGQQTSNSSGPITVPGAGSTGLVLQIVSPTPETFLF